MVRTILLIHPSLTAQLMHIRHAPRGPVLPDLLDKRTRTGITEGFLPRPTGSLDKEVRIGIRVSDPFRSSDLLVMKEQKSPIRIRRNLVRHSGIAPVFAAVPYFRAADILVCFAPLAKGTILQPAADQTPIIASAP